MAPLKKLKSVNRGIVIANDSAPSNKDDKSKNKKRKLTDMLGPQWSKHEIERFYDAYRKYGQDWKKVAAVVRSRSIGMVETLYNVNRAYLSLPEGTASVVGLIAMMTDHYNVLDGSGNENDCAGPEVMAQKIQKNPKAKNLVGSSKDSVKCQSASSDGCLSLLKTCGDGIQPHFPVRIPVRKRTPRVPVSCLDNNPSKKSRTSVMHANDEGVLHGESMLTKEWKNPNSSQGLQMRYKNFEHTKAAKEQEISPFQGLKIRNGGYAADEESKDGSLGCNVARIGILPKESVDLGESAKAAYKKGKKDEVQPSEAILSDNIWERYPYGDKGANRNSSGGKGVKICREGRRKRSNKMTHEDELEACDALHALAEISSMMPFLDAEHVVDGGESMVRRDAVADRVTHSDVTLSDEKLSDGDQKKSMRAGKAETPDCSTKSAENESVADDEVKSGNSSGQIYAISKRSYSSVISPDLSSSNDPRCGELEIAVSSAQDHAASEVVNTVKRKNKRKRDRTLLVKDRNNAPNCLSGGLSVLQDKLLDVKGKLSHCLSWHDVRKWCMYEWFYCAIDYPWFAKREFEEYLNHVGLGHIPRLTRSELGVIRSSLGKPRRFSEHFLQAEREKLKHYRESVRIHYTNVRAGRGGLPPDLACPLYVGQQVVAIHPKTRECHNGSVLTVDHDNCRVQFHHPHLGVELVKDLDCMPLNPLENIPESIRRRKRLFDYQYIQHPEVNGAISSAFEEHMNSVDHNLCVPPLSPSSTNDLKVKPASLSLHTKAVANGSLSTQLATQNHSRNLAQMLTHEAYERPILEFIRDSDRNVTDQHNTGAENFPSLHLSVRDAVDLSKTMHSSNNKSFCCEETASNVAEIVEGSREKAQKMVDTAIKAMSIMKEDEDAFDMISDALDDNCRADRATNGRSSMAMNSNTIRGSLPPQNLVASCNSMPQSTSDVKSDLEIPADLITSCVATLFMIQTCTERQNPPAEVAQILDNAATSLHPCCPQNVSIYREIQMCMGRIKTQILALVPT